MMLHMGNIIPDGSTSEKIPTPIGGYHLKKPWDPNLPMGSTEIHLIDCWISLLCSTEIQQSINCTLKLHSICADINRYNYANASLCADPLKQHKMVRCPQPRLHSIQQCVAHQITITAIPGQHRDAAVNQMYTQTALTMCRYKQVQLCQCQPVC